jgi:putative SOS response-associated peptidase YedK
MAGIYEFSQDINGKTTYTFTILTTKPLDSIKHIHDRMPLILDKQNENLWINENTLTQDLNNLIDLGAIKQELKFLSLKKIPSSN